MMLKAYKNHILAKLKLVEFASIQGLKSSNNYGIKLACKICS